MPDDNVEIPAIPRAPQTGVVVGARVAIAHITAADRVPCYAVTFRHPPLPDRTFAFSSKGRDQFLSALHSAPIDQLVTRVAILDVVAFEKGMATFNEASSGVDAAANARNIIDYVNRSLVADIRASTTLNDLVLVSGQIHDGDAFDVILPPHGVPVLIGMLRD